MASVQKSIVLLGCFDTKGPDFSFLRACILGHGESVMTINTGTYGSTGDFPVDFEANRVASAAGHTLAELQERADRGYAVDVMGRGAASILKRLHEEGKLKAVMGMGGGGGTYIALAAMQAVPLGIPKLCVSTVASKDLSRQVGSKDIALMPSVVDIAGLNSISRMLIKQAAAALCGMANVQGESETSDTKGRIAISMFGNTTACVTACTELLQARGYEVFVFHANGVGGQTMESLIDEGCFDGVLDLTTTELADELCGGICSAGPARMEAATRCGVPQVVAPGCLDMVNFAHPDTVPPRYRQRQFYHWAPDVTLMRTDAEENRQLAGLLTGKLNRAQAPVAILLPTYGLSQIDAEGGVFSAPETNRALFDTIRATASEHIAVTEIAAHINEEVFARQAVETLLQLMGR
ncbi:Tm-1-like ATP-binding domain-containing protein [Parapedobacter sp. 10938]|uniref:Tm-1-like ATP-binding domain-containing protein n=1 Tax=Parapedobacter flavus TaxID=3110225 RepID=UPI002DB8FE08|nr:Tm-1-like ATP-binding domain-containing protein [Parapedobacter sp. 10938]MEC3881595.1 Tm-1-like ATP-binding domain-containing protein [Parapedobacter sp. 10938]